VTKALYIVIESMERWWVDFEGRGHGPYLSREEAALEGKTLAQFRAHMNRPAEVLVPDAGGKYWVVWSSAGAAAGVPRPVSTPAARDAA
jgi:hypothetical protein